MPSIKKLLLIIFVGSSLIFLQNCDSDQQKKPIDAPNTNVRGQNSPAFTLPERFASLKNEVRRADLNHDGYDDAIVMTYPNDSYESVIGFDSLFIYQYLPDSSKFALKFQRAYYYGANLDVKDLSKDSFPEIYIFTDGGGNSDVASLGLTVIGYKSGSYIETLSLDNGAPQIIQLGSDTAFAVLVQNEYWPQEISHAESVSYVDDIHPLSASLAFKKDSVVAWKFQSEFATAQKDYASAKEKISQKKDDDAAFALYSAAVRQIIYERKLKMDKEVISWFSGEQKFLKGVLPQEYTAALNDLMNTKTPM